MKNKLRNNLKELALFFIICILTFFIYGFIHEASHLVAVVGFGLDYSIEINLLANPPIYEIRLIGIESVSKIEFFIIRVLPYVVSAILMFLLFLFFIPKSAVSFAVPSAILLFDWSNILNILLKQGGTLGNDFIAVYSWLGLPYYLGMILIVLLTSFFYLAIIVKFVNNAKCKGFMRRGLALKFEKG